ncbi:MAG: ankyrin repeat domain-containing protein [Bacteroidota bacterium]
MTTFLSAIERQSLVGAVEKSDINIAKGLLEKRINPDGLIIGGAGDSLLHMAIKKKDEAMTRLLLTYMQNPNVLNNQGFAALHLAVGKQTTNIVELLLSNSRVNPNQKTTIEQATPLHWAAFFVNIELIQLLLPHTDQPGEPEYRGNTLLHLAALEQSSAGDQVEKEKIKVLITIIELLKNPAINPEKTNKNDETFLDILMDSNKYDEETQKYFKKLFDESVQQNPIPPVVNHHGGSYKKAVTIGIILIGLIGIATLFILLGEYTKGEIVKKDAQELSNLQ